MKKLPFIILALLIVFILLDWFYFKKWIYPIINKCVPIGGYGNSFYERERKCCPGSRVYRPTREEILAGYRVLSTFSFRCERISTQD